MRLSKLNRLIENLDESIDETEGVIRNTVRGLKNVEDKDEMISYLNDFVSRVKDYVEDVRDEFDKLEGYIEDNPDDPEEDDDYEDDDWEE